MAGGGHEIGVERGVAGEPGGERAGGIRAATISEGLGDAPDIDGAIDVEWRDGKVAFGLPGFLFVGGYERVGVAGDNTGFLLFLQFCLGVAHNAGGAFDTGKVDKAMEAEVEEVIAGGDEEIIIEAEGVNGKFDVGNGTEAVVVVRGAVVKDGNRVGEVLPGFPVVEVADEFVVADHYQLVNNRDFIYIVEKAVKNGFAADFQERFGGIEGEWVHPGGVAGCEYYALHCRSGLGVCRFVKLGLVYIRTPSSLSQRWKEYLPLRAGYLARYFSVTCSSIFSAKDGSMSAIQQPLKPAPEKRPP